MVAEPSAEALASAPLSSEERVAKKNEAKNEAKNDAKNEAKNDAKNEAKNDARFEGLPEEVQGVLRLFGAQLSQLAFPEVDAVVLSRHADEVVAQRRAVEAARAELEAASAELARRTEELGSLARRGLAYAKIYAAAHPERAELAAELARLESRERPVKVAPKRDDGSPAPRRGRPPKTPRPELPFAVERGVAVAPVADALAAPVEADQAANEDPSGGSDEGSDEGSNDGFRDESGAGAADPVLERDESDDAASDA